MSFQKTSNVSTLCLNMYTHYVLFLIQKVLIEIIIFHNAFFLLQQNLLQRQAEDIFCLPHVSFSRLGERAIANFEH